MDFVRRMDDSDNYQVSVVSFSALFLMSLSHPHLGHAVSTAIPPICQTFPSCEDFKGRIKFFEVLDSNISNTHAVPSVHLQPSYWRFSVVSCPAGCVLYCIHISGGVLTSNVLW